MVFIKVLEYLLTKHQKHQTVRNAVKHDVGGGVIFKFLKIALRRQPFSPITFWSLLDAIKAFEIIYCAVGLRQNMPGPAASRAYHTRQVTIKGTFSCSSRAGCYTCSFLNSTKSISVPKSNFVIRHNFTCTSSNIINCISCSKCCKLYIGETGRRLSSGTKVFNKSDRLEQWCWQACCATF